MKYWKLLLILSLSFYYSIYFGQSYSSSLDPWDNWQIVMRNPRLFEVYTKCIFDEGPCTKTGRNLKLILKDFFENECFNCSEREKNIARDILTHIEVNKPDVWNQILIKYGSDEKKEFLKLFTVKEKLTER